MSFLNSLKKPAWVIAVSALGFAAFCILLVKCVAFGGGFMPVIGTLLDLLFSLGILGGLIALLVTKKNELFKSFFFIYFAYWIIRNIHGGFDAAGAVVEGMPGIYVAYAFFLFFTALILLGVFVLFVLAKILKKNSLKPIALLAMLGNLFFFFLTMILAIAVSAKYDSPWDSYFYAFGQFALPVGLTFAYITVDEEALDMAAAFGTKKSAPAETPAEAEEEIVEETAKSEEEIVEETVEANEETVEEEEPTEGTDPQE